MVIRSIACALLLASTALAQSAPHNEPLAELSYHPTGKLIYIPVEINGAGPFMFCFDSGAPNSIVDTAVAQKLSLQVVTQPITSATRRIRFRDGSYGAIWHGHTANITVEGQNLAEQD